MRFGFLGNIPFVLVLYKNTFDAKRCSKKTKPRVSMKIRHALWEYVKDVNESYKLCFSHTRTMMSKMSLYNLHFPYSYNTCFACLFKCSRVKFYRKVDGGDTKLVPVIQSAQTISILAIGILLYINQYFSTQLIVTIPASIQRKSTSGRHRPVSYPDGSMTARYRFM